MSFLHFGLLALLPLAAIPVVLHLLTLHRLKTVELSTFRFLFDSYIQQRRRMQFLEALLAMLRTLFLVAAVLMIAGLVISSRSSLFGAAGGGKRDVILLVDCSASMKARSGGQSAFERAKSAALVVAKNLRPTDTLTLIQVGAQPHERFSNFTSDAKGVEDAITGLQTTASRGNIFAALMHLFGPDASKRTNPLVYLFTDCQGSGWREVKNQGLEGLIPDKTPFVVVNVGSTEDMSNRAVVGDAPRRGRAVAGLPYLLQPRVVNSSKTENAEVTLSVLIKDKEVSRFPLILKPGETAVRRIPYTPREPGPLLGRFEIASTTPDRFPDDDHYLFALNVSPRIKAVIVDGQPPGQPIVDVDEAHYLEVALTSGVHTPATDGKPPAEGADDFLRPFDVQRIPEAGVTPDALKDARLVVLANCGELQPPQFEMLRTFVAGGGGLLIFPGDRVNPKVYDDQFFPVPGPQGERLTAARLEAPEGDLDKTETFQQLGKIDFGHPALSLFDIPDPEARPLTSFRIYKRFKIAMPEKKGNAWALAWFGNGSPALVESRLGDGDVILSAFPAHTRWTSLPTRPDFAPLAMQLANHVARRPPVDGPSVVLADGTAEFAVNGLWGDVKAEVKTPSGLVVDQQFERSGPRLLGSFTETSERGYYTLNVKSKSVGQSKAGNTAFAVNLSPEESDFTMLGEDKLHDLLPSAALTYVDASADAAGVRSLVTDEKSEVGRGWWFALLLAVMVSEFFLATWGGRRKKAEEESLGTERVEQARAGSWVGGMAGARAK
jgi:von Willebrand factor type A domain/Aerotolerance regulator N-terminal